MMKRTFTFLAGIVVACAFTFNIGGCATPPGGPTLSPADQFTKDATLATNLVDQVTLAADAAVKVDVLKGADAATTLAAIKAARDGLNVAKGMAQTDPQKGLSRLGMVTAALAATQVYIATLGVKR